MDKTGETSAHPIKIIIHDHLTNRDDEVTGKESDSGARDGGGGSGIRGGN